MRRIPFAILLLALVSCRGDKESAEEAPRIVPEAPSPAPAAEPERTISPPAIDPDREEAIRTGTPAERLLAKYDLLVERILLERAESVFNANRTIDQGLLPLANEQNRLLAEGVFDSTLTLEFARLAEFVFARHILSQGDPFGRDAKSRIAKIREMIPDHERREP